MKTAFAVEIGFASKDVCHQLLMSGGKSYKPVCAVFNSSFDVKDWHEHCTAEVCISFQEAGCKEAPNESRNQIAV